MALSRNPCKIISGKRLIVVVRSNAWGTLALQMLTELKVTAIWEDNVIIGIEHQTLAIAAVQFHPESIMTLNGKIGLAIIKKE